MRHTIKVDKKVARAIKEHKRGRDMNPNNDPVIQLYTSQNSRRERSDSHKRVVSIIHSKSPRRVGRYSRPEMEISKLGNLYKGTLSHNIADQSSAEEPCFKLKVLATSGKE